MFVPFFFPPNTKRFQGFGGGDVYCLTFSHLTKNTNCFKKKPLKYNLPLNSIWKTVFQTQGSDSLLKKKESVFGQFIYLLLLFLFLLIPDLPGGKCLLSIHLSQFRSPELTRKLSLATPQVSLKVKIKWLLKGGKGDERDFFNTHFKLETTKKVKLGSDLTNTLVTLYTVMPLSSNDSDW